MTRDEARKAAEVMLAYAEGKEVELLVVGNRWEVYTDNEAPDFNWRDYHYRIKPSLKYRLFNSVEECWQEMQKHQPFGWVRETATGELHSITYLEKSKNAEKGFIIWLSDLNMTVAEMYDQYTFADGNPFGVKE